MWISGVDVALGSGLDIGGWLGCGYRMWVWELVWMWNGGTVWMWIWDVDVALGNGFGVDSGYGDSGLRIVILWIKELWTMCGCWMWDKGLILRIVDVDGRI